MVDQTCLGLAARFNINEKHWMTALAVVKALADCCECDEAKIHLGLPISQLKSMSGKKPEPGRLAKYLERCLELKIDAQGRVSLIGPYPSSESFYQRVMAPSFRYVGDWVYWFIYSYLRYAVLEVDCEGQGRKRIVSGREYLDLELREEKAIEFGGNIRPENLDYARRFNIQPKHIPIMLALRRCFAELSNIEEAQLGPDCTSRGLLGWICDIPDAVEVIMLMEESLDVGVGDGDEIHFCFPHPYASRLFRSRSICPFYHFGDWVYWFIYNFIRYNQIHFFAKGGRPGSNISGQEYLDQ